ncbi:MAG: DnaT-like ssDNA-binding protein, partial [Psychrobium sp.]
ENANSFVTDEEFKAYANIEGSSVPATQPDREALLIIAMKYIVAKEDKYKGCRVSYEQELPFPRRLMTVNNFNVASDAIHKNVKKAQMELALQAANSELFVSGQTQNIASEKLGELQVDYFAGGSSAIIRTDSADVFLNPLMKYNGNDNKTVRV